MSLRTQYKEIGYQGEECASSFLQRQGYDIKARNWYPAHKTDEECDIIAITPDNSLAIIEVKTRTKDDNFPTERFVTPAKQRKMISLYKSYVKEHQDYKDLPFQFDVVIVTLLPTRVRIKHIQRAITYLPSI